MSIAALSCCSSQLGGFTYGAVVGRAGSSLAAVTLALEMDDHSSHCLNRSSPTSSSSSSSSHFVNEITRYKLALLQQQQQQHGASVVVVAGQQNGSVEPRLADENNYMLRSGAAAAAAAASASGGVQCSVSAAGTVVALAGSASGGQSLECQPIPAAAAAAVVSRPRSASLSLVSRLSSPCRHPTHSHPPTPPPLHLGDSTAAPLLLARSARPSITRHAPDTSATATATPPASRPTPDAAPPRPSHPSRPAPAKRPSMTFHHRHCRRQCLRMW
ncbi:hypothetical protein DAPPUDRAFT_111820 [Daphnia pulex]|uniref:Uncharacterized protein n=1 Tax=Daphnia pulex TaxID=6669 RepID=E9HA72_DAPPU|nr:hypothetical protein DAPPUDRAFT_111820 [Daphnia pulex]|eukprot:EFX71400.1 hypothetical protein DAPPUDRAFT_111820 [Daphnia pulex]